MKQNAKNDGSAFESMVIMANHMYQARGIAFVEKTPNPWKVKRKGPVIVSAYPTKEGRLVDFIGLVRSGTGIAFDAKSTIVETRFELANIEDHQVRFLQQYDQLGGIAFLLVEFVKHREVFLLPIPDLAQYWGEAQAGGRKSIPYEDFVKKFPLVKQSRGIILDYLVAYASIMTDESGV